MAATTRTHKAAFFTIGDVSRLAHLAPETIRRYERQGLIAPARTAAGVRIYSPAAVAAVQELRAQRAANARHGGDVAA